MFRALFNFYGNKYVETGESPLDAQMKLEEKLKKKGIDFKRYLQ